MLLSVGAATPSQPTNSPAVSCGHVTVQSFRHFAEAVWAPSRWRRGQPKETTIAAYHRKLRCAPNSKSLDKFGQIWRSAKRRYYERQRIEQFRRSITPFWGCTPYGCGWYSLPVPLVICESGGNYHFPYGAYSILDPAWHAWGGKTAHADEASKHEQDRVAHYGYSHYGEAPWECKSDGLPHPF